MYGSGSHPIGPDYQFKVFETSAPFFTDSSRFDRRPHNAGTTLTMDVSFQYRIDESARRAYDQTGTD